VYGRRTLGLRVRAALVNKGRPQSLLLPRVPRALTLAAADCYVRRHWKAHSGAMTDLSETAAETEELTHTFSESHRQDAPPSAHSARPKHSDGRQGKTASIAEYVKLLRLRELRGIRERNQPGGSEK
jgi:hypothetical protein